ncbi:hypothetical protein BCS42_11350 [Crenothrix sp. D3]|nr:hypothetical protein BCS42_11350 [Crenothrix sp. D3]
MEDNGSDTLLVFQAPGEEEWMKQGIPLYPEIKRGGTAGSRIKLSWEREQKCRNTSSPTRTDYDIVNVVQCFPDKDPNSNENRDAKPNVMAVCCCSNRLLTILQQKNYVKIIAFGDIAQQVLPSLISRLSLQPNFINAPHPTGGTLNTTLDALW